MTIEEIDKYLQSNIFIEKQTGDTFEFLNETMVINGVAVSNYSIEEKQGEYYLKHNKRLISPDPMLIKINPKWAEEQVVFINHVNNVIFSTLSAK